MIQIQIESSGKGGALSCQMQYARLMTKKKHGRPKDKTHPILSISVHVDRLTMNKGEKISSSACNENGEVPGLNVTSEIKGHTGSISIIRMSFLTRLIMTYL